MSTPTIWSSQTKQSSSWSNTGRVSTAWAGTVKNTTAYSQAGRITSQWVGISKSVAQWSLITKYTGAWTNATKTVSTWNAASVKNLATWLNTQKNITAYTLTGKLSVVWLYQPTVTASYAYNSSSITYDDEDYAYDYVNPLPSNTLNRLNLTAWGSA